MDKAKFGGVAVVLTAAAVAACGNGATGGKEANVPASPSVKAAAGTSCKGTSTAEALGRTGNGATVALAKVDGRRIAFVADEDARAIVTFDLESRTQIAETPMDATPGQLYVGNDGRIFATLRDKAQLAVLAAGRADAPLTRLCDVETPTEPIAIAASSDDATLVVTTGWGRKLIALDGKTLARRFDAELPREPRGVVVSDDGKTAFVSHAVGSIVSTVDLTETKHAAHVIPLRGYSPGELAMVRQQRKLAAQMEKQNPAAAKQLEDERARDLEAGGHREGEPTCQGFTLAKSTAVGGRIFAPQVFVNPGDFNSRPDGYGDENTMTESPSIAVIDEGAAEPMGASLTLNQQRLFRGQRDTRDALPECLLPRASVVDNATRSILVTCYGIDAVVAYDATSANPMATERRRWTVGSGPSGIAIDGEKHRAVVWSQFDRTVSTFPIGSNELLDDKATPPLVQRSALSPLAKKVSAEYALGRILFHAAGDTRISSDGRACASCHPDGRDDAITWATPEGPRRSIMLAGRVSQTSPYSWNGSESTIPNHLGNTFDRLSGKGLRSIELDALVTYLSSMPAPPRAPVTDAATVERGRKIFASKEAQCSSCHAGASYTDGQNHDVGSRHPADRSGSFNTPTLHLVGGTGPYFHDGRYATLGELLKKSDGKMGHTKQLSQADLDSLETFLRTL